MGLNPSTSDGKFLDNTTKKIIKICNNNFYGKVRIINLFGLISKYPNSLPSHKDPIGKFNNGVIKSNLNYWSKNPNCDLWLGWGNKGSLFRRNDDITSILLDYCSVKKTKFRGYKPPLCLKKTKLLNPIHPLYCSDNSDLVEYIN